MLRNLLPLPLLIAASLLASCGEATVQDGSMENYHNSIYEIIRNLNSEDKQEKSDLFRRSIFRVEASSMNLTQYDSLTADEIISDAKVKAAALLDGMTADEVILFSKNATNNPDLDSEQSVRIKINDMLCNDSSPSADLTKCSLPIQAQKVLLSASWVSNQVNNHIAKGLPLPKNRCGINEDSYLSCSDPTGGLLKDTVYFEIEGSNIFILYEFKEPLLCKYMDEGDRIYGVPSAYSSCSLDGKTYRIVLHDSPSIEAAFNMAFSGYEEELRRAAIAIN